MFGRGFIEAARAPFQDPNWLRKFSLGGLLSLLSQLALGLMIADQVPKVLLPVIMIFALILMFVVWGYLFRIFVDSLNGLERKMLPDWQDWKGYATAGFWLFLVMLGYVLIAAIGLWGLLSVLGVLPFDGRQEQVAKLLIIIMATCAFLYGFFPIVFARFAAEGRIWSCFDPAAIWGDIRTVVGGDYIRSCLSFYGFSIVGNLVLVGLPYIGLPLVSIYLFYLMAVFSLIFGSLIGVTTQKTNL